MPSEAAPRREMLVSFADVASVLLDQYKTTSEEKIQVGAVASAFTRTFQLLTELAIERYLNCNSPELSPAVPLPIASESAPRREMLVSAFQFRTLPRAS